MLSNSLIQVTVTNTANSSVCMIKAQSPFQNAKEDYFFIEPTPLFIGRKIKWDLEKADTLEIEGNSQIKSSVNITELYSDLKYPLTIQTKFPIHIKSPDGAVHTNYKIRSNKIHVGLEIESKQYAI